jgi:hypothetical protein
LSLSETKKYIFYILRLPLPTISNLPWACLKQWNRYFIAQGRLEIVGRGCLKIYSANEDDTGTYTCRAENLLDSVDSDASLVVLGKY